jgi:mono/diheme cytochrome c family protein
MSAKVIFLSRYSRALGSRARQATLLAVCLLFTAGGAEVFSADPAGEGLKEQFVREVAPVLKANCQECHGPDLAEAKLDLSRVADGDVLGSHRIWQAVRERLESKEMPPEDATRRPTAEEREAVIDWIRAARKHVAERDAGDPGVVLARRLNAAEYNYTIRDLVGVDLRPAREFPVDPASEAGFDNSSESLAMSPALAKKYLAAARQVAEHLVLTPGGLAFAPHPVMTDTDRDKYCVRRIVEFYKRQPTDLADYFEAAWRYQHRAALEQADASLEDVARQSGVSPKYLALVWTTLTDTKDDAGPIARLRTMWRELPPARGRESLAEDDSPSGNANHRQRLPTPSRAGCEAMRKFVVELRKKLEPKLQDLEVRGIHEGSQPFVLWKNGQYAAYRRTYFKAALDDLDLPQDAAERARHATAYERFCSVFPDAFYVSERGRDYVGKPKDEQEKGRLLSAGFHSMMGYYRDDRPLVDLVLDEAQQAELDGLWQELDFVTQAPMRQYTGFLWFERTDSRYLRDQEFDFARSEDKDVTSQEKIKRLAEVYLAKARRSGGEGTPIKAIEDYFATINAQIRWVEEARLAAEPKQLTALTTLAERAFRRPLADAEREDLLAFYRHLRDEQELSHEEAVQDTLVYVLMSPAFCYRMDLARADEGRRPLTDYELASRLSFFLWSSMPDQTLLRLAAAGELHKPQVLAAQARRMLRDEKVRGLALEFGGNWLDFRRFEEHNSVDRERFPSFTNQLRQAMFEEPVRFFVEVAQQDGSVLDFLYGKHTFVNAALAQHYGLPVASLGPDEWVRVSKADEHGRGGLLAMSVFLTQNSPGLRTSPVKRGYWVVRRVLGERIPAPPPNVPELPADEAKLGELTLRETLARHRESKSCATCHERFDSVGLAFEGYGPIGERRERDLGGRPVQTSATFPGGISGSGLTGLQTYLREHRQEQFLDNLCRKLLSYALGRSLLPSDDRTVDTMRSRLAAEDHRFGSLIEAIVTSPQFLTKRGTATAARE